MATDFIMPRLPAPSQNPYMQKPIHFAPPSPPQPQHQPQHQHQHQHQQQPQPQHYPYGANAHHISPLSTSGNNSPASPKSYHARQLRPLYMPAVLRPTEYPSKAPPPPARPDDEPADASRLLRSSGSFISLPGLATIGRLARRSTGDSGKFVDGAWNLDLFPEVKGQPSRAHWKPDPNSTICDDPTCKKHFTYFTRRHHCRRCGDIFCDLHSAYVVPLDESANYNPRGAASRACAHCFAEFKVWRSRTSSQVSSSSSSTPNHSATAPNSPVAASSPVPLSAAAAAGAAAANGTKPDAAHSVPHDWNWSTF